MSRRRTPLDRRRPGRAGGGGGGSGRGRCPGTRGARARQRGGASSSTSRSKGMSWWAKAARLCSRTRSSSCTKLGSPVRSVRRTRVLTKNPARSSSASSVRPATGVPMGMSLPAPRRLRSTARAAWSTMKMVTPCWRASSVRRACKAGGMARGVVAPRWPAVAGRGRSAGRDSSSGIPARVSRQYASCRLRRLVGSAGSPSEATASSPRGAARRENTVPTGAPGQSMSGREASRRAASSSPPVTGRRSPMDTRLR